MENTKTIKGRMQHKHHTEADWYTAGTAANPFCPLEGELIIYDPDAIYKHYRTKYGKKDTNGKLIPVHLLPWAEGCEESVGLEYTLVGDLNFYTVQGIGTCTDEKIVIPKGHNGLPIKKIENNAFLNKTNIVSINGQSIEYLGEKAFYGCENLKTVEMPKLDSLDNQVFMGCLSLVDVITSSSVQTIYSEAFSNCSSLSSIYLPDSTKSIQDHAFSNCTSITSLFIPKTISNIGFEAFSGCVNATFYCEGESKPSNWDQNWNPDNRPVVWGATRDVLKLNEKASSIGLATQESNGLMSAEDKKKLDEIATSLTPEDIGAAKEVHSHAGEDITSGTVAAARLPKASADSAGITIVYPADSCTTFTSDSGAVTPLAVQKAAKMFSITRPGATTKNGIVRYSNTTGDVKDSTILIEDVKNTANVSMSGSVISIPSSNDKKLVYGYCTDQIDGTAFIAGLFASDATTFGYQAGLAIGGTSGNLLWKGNKVITEKDFDDAVGDVASAISVINERQRYLIDGTNLTNNISEEESE